jgi:hypothetical protein
MFLFYILQNSILAKAVYTSKVYLPYIILGSCSK